MPRPTALIGRSLVAGAAQGELLFADVGLSFWGGVDPVSGEVIDRHHPLSGQHLGGRVLAIPSGRGSCTGSSVLMELISNGHAPAALVLAEPDEILTLGVLVAQTIFERSLPVLCIGRERFDTVRAKVFARLEGTSLTLFDYVPEDTWRAPPDPLTTADTHPSIELTEHDQALLAGHHGKAAQVAMQIVLRMAQLQGARCLLDVTQAHIDGCIYTGPASLRFAEQLVQWGATVRVPTTLNSISVDQRRWRELGIDPALGIPASALGDAYMAMGAQLSFTCAPYLLDSAPKAGDQIVWAESNAVVYANSVLGARTLKYPDYLDICIALTGRAPQVGCHLEAHRKAQLSIALPPLHVLDDAFYPLLGYHVGTLSGSRIPLVLGLEQHTPSLDDLKAFGAAFATTSAAPLFHIAGVTPEAVDRARVLEAGSTVPMETISLEDLLRSWRELNSARDSRVDVVSLGNPHFSLSEFAHLARLCKGRYKHPDVVIAITCGRAVLEQAREAGHIAVIEAFGATLVTDTCWCMLGEPVIPPTATTLMTNSGKYAHYAPGLVGRKVHFSSLADCVDSACSATASGRLPVWLQPAAVLEGRAHV
ncbi:MULTISPECIES: aconitase family protein [unclassified Pseudomonas]|uniref:cis-3-hydroxy-L-proline dehydratase n=1 Tax=unclassified Pseudomonas TaxID=196821 RepID=UPI002AC90DC3|nr:MULTISPECIES: aconitase family protein [unclassified Pseudomonas]MEB0047504.1 aconitase family protein [Pseudomonas sp. Dout3]MEB0097947.1 aconitase family protein [Pseudomonas sp. DC1.2]WPX56975.1 aconitase family protein [Pseudomonas sp. DC1.2]